MKNDILFQVEMITENITRIAVPGNVYCYYFEGSERGLLVDTGYGYGDLKTFVDSLSTKPYDVALTHGHVDHAGGAAQWENVYMSRKDLDVAKGYTEVTFRMNYIKNNGVTDAAIEDMVPEYPEENYLDIEDGKTFGLGGLHCRFIALPGHTPGSMGVYIPEMQIMFFGDAVNSLGFMQLPESTSIAEYKKYLIKFSEEYDGKYSKTLFSHPHNFGGTEIVPEMIELCDELLVDSEMGQDMSQMLGAGVLVAKPVHLDMSDAATVFHRLDGKTANVVYRAGHVKE